MADQLEQEDRTEQELYNAIVGNHATSHSILTAKLEMHDGNFETLRLCGGDQWFAIRHSVTAESSCLTKDHQLQRHFDVETEFLSSYLSVFSTRQWVVALIVNLLTVVDDLEFLCQFV